MNIEKGTKIKDIMKLPGNVIKVFDEYGLDCPGCKGQEHDTVYIVAENNGLDLGKFLKDLNDAAGK